jgi:acyl carrier protein
MTSYEDIRSQIFELLQPFVKDGQTLSEDTDLVADLGLDSLKVMNLIEAVEDRLDISIPLNILTEIQTIKDFSLQLQRVIAENK